MNTLWNNAVSNINPYVNKAVTKPDGSGGTTKTLITVRYLFRVIFLPTQHLTHS